MQITGELQPLLEPLGKDALFLFLTPGTHA